VSQRVPTTRRDAPAYLARYQERRVQASAPAGPGGRGEPPYVAHARERAAERASREIHAEAPPGGVSVEYALEIVSPRELVPPPWFHAKRMLGSVDVRLIRHGQTQSYSTDGGLTPLGHWQAHRRGQDLARGVAPGMTIRLPHAPTARAQETALALREGLLQGLARYHIEANVEPPHPHDGFRNFQVWCEGRVQDPTQAFVRFATLLEDYERHKSGDRPGWLVEMERFWNIQAAGGDPITHWLRMPMQYFEPAAVCVRRFWKAIVEEVREGPEDLRVFVATHSGPIRAVATAALGHDPGEPTNLEDVRVRVHPDLEHAIVTYRERGLEIEIPCRTAPPWNVAADAW
jgi:broad specificity phosphatase PhoE